MTGNIIRVNDVSLQFRIYGVGSQSLKKQIISFGTGGRLARGASNHFVVEALRDISFELKDGDRLGIIGGNGAGKSTLLRVLAGIYQPHSGSVELHGKPIAIIDPSVGLDPQATGYENIRTRAVMLGISPSEQAAFTENVASVSELGDYLAMPVHTYSSGMWLRLNFAMCVSVSPDILLLDEWLSVADQSFVQKAQALMQQLVDKSSILVVASHNLELIRQVCNRGLYLMEGEIRFVGEIDETIAAYCESVTGA